jgi:folate-dependent phosphoribosylglycinamide formyltransferase PurN
MAEGAPLAAAENLPQRIVDIFGKSQGGKEKQKPRMALFMSGEGTLARAILGDEEIRDLYDIRLLVSDNENSNAKEIAGDPKYKMPHQDALEARVKKIGKFSDPDRPEDFDLIAEELGSREIDAAIFAGFLKIATPEFCQKVPATSCHPADLANFHNPDRTRTYTGWRGMSQMRAEQQGLMRSTIHAVTPKLDNGLAFSLTEAVYPDFALSDEEAQEYLKAEEGITYTGTLRLLGRGAIHLDGKLPLAAKEVEWLNDNPGEDNRSSDLLLPAAA